MESAEITTPIKYEGLQGDVNPHHLQERLKVVDKIRFDSIKHRDIHYAESPHFIVVFQDTKPYEDFDAPSMQGPEDLAYYLEGGLKIARDKFQLKDLDGFQVLRVKRGSRLRTADGLHYQSRERVLSIKDYEYARFNTIQARGKADTNVPRAYAVAMHEAIGHGYLAPGLLSEEGQGIPFLNEGLSTYIEYYASGRDPHDYLRMQMISLTDDKLKTLMGDWKTDDDFNKALGQSGFGDFSVQDCFKLAGKFGNVSERDYASVKKPPNYSDYAKGSSFIKYFVDTFGVDAFKSWALNITRNNFLESLEKVTGKKVAGLEHEWKDSVLTGFMSSVIVTDRLETATLNTQLDEYNEMTRVRSTFQDHSM